MKKSDVTPCYSNVTPNVTPFLLLSHGFDGKMLQVTPKMKKNEFFEDENILILIWCNIVTFSAETFDKIEKLL